MKIKNAIYFAQLPLSILFMELVSAVYCFHGLKGWGTLYTFLFSAAAGGILMLISSAWKHRDNRAIGLACYIALTLVFGGQTVYFTVFKTFTGFYALTFAGDAIGEFWEQALAGIWTAKFALIAIFIPLVLNIVFGDRLIPEKRISLRAVIAVLAGVIAVQLGTAALIKSNDAGILSYKYVYYDTYSPLLSVPRFGMLTSMRLEILDSLGSESIPASAETDAVTETPSPLPSPEAAPEPYPEPEYGVNALDIDFASLIETETDGKIRQMHEYFAAQTPTKQNSHTGMFEGKNLIWIVAESYSAGALDETHTPTLWRLAHEGFVFENFYNPIWYGSTSDGEFVTLTGLLPKSGKISFKASSDKYMPFGFGTLFSKLGYTSRAFHDHTYTYYGRDKSHPNLGYDYMGVGNGLEIKKQWPESDVEMIEQTVPMYIDSESFHIYYLTVSGHMLYTFTGNMMSSKHRDEVADLPYTEGSRAYIAAMTETDRAIELLIEKLSEAGKLDDTVIVISGDHYPYGLAQESLDELGMPDDAFELYRSSLILWNSAAETETVEKYCYAADIMPTLCNLFKLPYDSRLVSGQDVFSDAPALVVFNDRSFITDMGRYDSASDTFTPNEGAEVPDGYAAEMLQNVNDRFNYASKIIDYDYYAKILGGEAN